MEPGDRVQRRVRKCNAKGLRRAVAGHLTCADI
jgi:hypothetical protein